MTCMMHLLYLIRSQDRERQRNFSYKKSTRSSFYLKICGFNALNTPILIQSLKLGHVESEYYLDWWSSRISSEDDFPTEPRLGEVNAFLIEILANAQVAFFPLSNLSLSLFFGLSRSLFFPPSLSLSLPVPYLFCTLNFYF